MATVIELYTPEERESLESIDRELAALDGEGRDLYDGERFAVTERQFLLGWRETWRKSLAQLVRARHLQGASAGGPDHAR